MIKKILVTVIALSLFACTSGKLEQLGGVRTLSAFKGYIVKNKVKKVCENMLNGSYLVGDTIYRVQISKDILLKEVDITRYDFETYNLGDTIK